MLFDYIFIVEKIYYRMQKLQDCAQLRQLFKFHVYNILFIEFYAQYSIHTSLCILFFTQQFCISFFAQQFVQSIMNIVLYAFCIVCIHIFIVYCVLYSTHCNTFYFFSRNIYFLLSYYLDHVLLVTELKYYIK